MPFVLEQLVPDQQGHAERTSRIASRRLNPEILETRFPVRLVEFSLRRRVTVSMCAVALVLFGLVAFGRLPINLLPDISYPSLAVETRFAGAAPEEVEALVSRPVEEHKTQLTPRQTQKRKTRWTLPILPGSGCALTTPQT